MKDSFDIETKRKIFQVILSSNLPQDVLLLNRV